LKIDDLGRSVRPAMNGGARFVGALGCIALAPVIGLTTRAGAATAVVSGWWTTLPVSPGPDVAAGQLLVQGGSDAATPIAYAGISLALADGETPEKLVLAVVPNSASTTSATTLELCPLLSFAHPADGEAAQNGPRFDCGTAKVTAAPSADAMTYEFAVSGFARSGSLDVAVLPTMATDRVVLVSPSPSALQSSYAPVETTGSTESAEPDVTFSADTTSNTPLFSPEGVLLPAPDIPVPAITEPAPAIPEVPVATPAVSTAPIRVHHSHPWVAFLFASLAAIAILLWTVAGAAATSPDL
jgi:hypothetical protein